MSRSLQPSLDWSSSATTLLNSLSSAPITSSSHVTGMLAMPESAFAIHYKDRTDTARAINLYTADAADIDALAAASEPAAVRRQGKRVIDEKFRKSSRLCASSFSTPIVPERTELMDIIRTFLLDGKDCNREIDLELYELEIYEFGDSMAWGARTGEGSFCKSHRRAHHDDGVFASLVLTFPTSHTGGALALHPHEDDEHIFDTGVKLSARPAYMCYAVFWGDVKHEVLPVTTGHRITLQYDLSWAAKRATPSPSSFTEQRMEWTNMLQRLVDDDTVLPEGGLFCFGLRHSYDVPSIDALDIKSYRPYNMRRDLRGADRLLFSTLERLGLEPEVQISYELGTDHRGPRNQADVATRGLANHLVDINPLSRDWNDIKFDDLIQEENTISQEDLDVSQVVWITPVTSATQLKQPWSARDRNIRFWIEYERANYCLVARLSHYSERRKTSMKRKRAAGEIVEEEGPLMVKKRGV
ncbi:hypothetical protein PENSPDRAFT_735743 [Peniophora sp. CONT]|nr:hypothetical protein PENSPDRAFT_735743 [Peniophora sp. CONT]